MTSWTRQRLKKPAWSAALGRKGTGPNWGEALGHKISIALPFVEVPCNHVGGQNVKMTKSIGEEYRIHDNYDSSCNLESNPLSLNLLNISKQCVLCGSPIICTNKKQPPNTSHKLWITRRADEKVSPPWVIGDDHHPRPQPQWRTQHCTLELPKHHKPTEPTVRWDLSSK